MPRTLAELNTFGVHLLHEGEDYQLGVLLHDLDKADHIPVASHLNRLDALLRIIEGAAYRDVLLYRRAIKDDPEDVKLAKLYSAREGALKREEEEHRLLEEVFAQRRELYDRHPALRRSLDGQRRATHADVEAQLAQLTDKSERIIVRGNFYNKQAAELRGALNKESQRDKAEAENPAPRTSIDSTHTDSSIEEEQQPSAGSTTHAVSGRRPSAPSPAHQPRARGNSTASSASQKKNKWWTFGRS
ncbi:uncharacterized protein JCM10292_007161 [Rhodotorula paludigena]|uniref:uncharacterized protein n=1 Tax=Rhodotorula paludigena TaxID=86838 RepID=UPI00317F4E5C